MAKRPAEDDEDDILKVRKRRYEPKKKEAAEEDAPDEHGPPGKKGPQPEEDDDEDETPSLSTGYVALDILLDFRDDCMDWAKGHFLYAIIIGIAAFLFFTAVSFFFIHSWARYLNRPSLAAVLSAYDLGSFPETKLLADYALQYLSPHKPEVRSPFLFFQGAALCAIAERVVLADKPDYYRTAANYLKESARYGFLPSRASEGWFLLGKSLYHCGELEQCREPLRIALEDGYPYTKEVYWYLAQAYFLGASPDLQRAGQYLQRFQNEPTVLEEEIAESYMLETMIVLQTENIEAAEAVLAKVPQFSQFDLMRNFVKGQIEFFKARKLRQKAIELETDANPNQLRFDPNLLRLLPVAPAPVSPITPEVPEPTDGTPPMETPTAPAPVSPMNESALQELIRPSLPAPVLGMFDETSEVQQRIAVLRSLYADNVSDDEIIVLPKEESKQAPVPPPQPPQQPEDIQTDPFDGDPILKRAKEFRDAAAGYYQNAIASFTDTIHLADANDPWGRNARLLIGICYMEMGEPHNAEDYFRSLIEAFPASQEAAAAGFLLGEYDRTKGNSDAAFRSFAQTFGKLRQNPNYASFWLPKTMILERCTDMVRNDIEKQNYADAVKLLDLLTGVMSPEDIARLKGQIYESWAALLQSQADTTFGEQGNQMAKDAESKRRSAGAAFAALAQMLSDTREFSDLLWLGAENYRLGKDYRRAVIEYQKFIKANLIARRPEVNFRLGEMYLNLDFLAEAAYTLEEALHDFPSHLLVPQMRLVLSYVYYEQKEWDKAKVLLQLNLVGDASPASNPYRDSMYALGKISYEQGDLNSAIHYLEDAIKVHPEAIQAADANYMLAQAYLNQAATDVNELADNPPETVRRSIESIVQTNRHRALFYLEQTERILSDRQRALGLTEAEKLMYRNVHFTICTVLMDMERYDQAIPKLNTAATMYQDRPEALDALIKMAYAQRIVGKDTESLTTLRRAEVVLNQLEKSGTITDGDDWRSKIRGQMRR